MEQGAPAPTITRRSAIGLGLAGAIAAVTGRARAAAPASISERLGAAIAALGPQTPPEVATRTAWTLLDAMAALVHGAGQTSTGAFVRSALARSGAPSASVFGHAAQAPVELAAMANAFLIHADEIDDSDLRAQLRASAVIMPTALALAEALDASGAEFVRAAALGYTLQGRFAAPLGPIQRFGWMASGVWGPPAAAAMAASMMRLPASQIASAFALAGSASGGAFQYFYDSTEDKRLIVARGARIAVESAALARQGERGAARIFEGQAGLYRLFGGTGAAVPEPDALARDLGNLEGPLFIRPKFFAASHSIIPTLDGIFADVPKDFDTASVDRFVVRGDAGWASVLADKTNRFSAPDTRMGAMLNYSFVVAMFLLRRSAMPRDFDGDTMRDPAILALAGKARFQTVAGQPDLALDLIGRDGRRLMIRARTPPPGEQAPLDAERRRAKFDALTGPLMPPARRDALRAACLGVAQVSSMRRWAQTVRSLAGKISP